MQKEPISHETRPYNADQSYEVDTMRQRAELDRELAEAQREAAERQREASEAQRLVSEKLRESLAVNSDLLEELQR